MSWAPAGPSLSLLLLLPPSPSKENTPGKASCSCGRRHGTAKLSIMRLQQKVAGSKRAPHTHADPVPCTHADPSPSEKHASNQEKKHFYKVYYCYSKCVYTHTDPVPYGVADALLRIPHFEFPGSSMRIPRPLTWPGPAPSPAA